MLESWFWKVWYWSLAKPSSTKILSLLWSWMVSGFEYVHSMNWRAILSLALHLYYLQFNLTKSPAWIFCLGLEFFWTQTRVLSSWQILDLLYHCAFREKNAKERDQTKWIYIHSKTCPVFQGMGNFCLRTHYRCKGYCSNSRSSIFSVQLVC